MSHFRATTAQFVPAIRNTFSDGGLKPGEKLEQVGETKKSDTAVSEFEKPSGGRAGTFSLHVSEARERKLRTPEKKRGEREENHTEFARDGGNGSIGRVGGLGGTMHVTHLPTRRFFARSFARSGDGDDGRRERSETNASPIECRPCQKSRSPAGGEEEEEKKRARHFPFRPNAGPPPRQIATVRPPTSPPPSPPPPPPPLPLTITIAIAIAVTTVTASLM